MRTKTNTAAVSTRKSLPRPSAAARGNGNGHGHTNGNANGQAARAAKPDPVVLFQKYFKSVGPRTYAAQVKELANGNQLLVLIEGKRDPNTDEVRKTRIFVFGEDFPAFFRMLHETAAFLRANPLSEDVRRRRERFWSRKSRPAAEGEDVLPGKS